MKSNNYQNYSNYQKSKLILCFKKLEIMIFINLLLFYSVIKKLKNIKIRYFYTDRLQNYKTLQIICYKIFILQNFLGLVFLALHSSKNPQFFRFVSATYICSVLSLNHHIESVAAHVFMNGCNDHLQREHDAFSWHY